MEVLCGSVGHGEGQAGELCKVASTEKRIYNIVLQVLE